MDGAIRLVQRQQGEIAGLVAIVIEDNERTRSLREKYKCVSAVLPGTEWQRQANAQYFESFADYRPELAFPAIRRQV